jgi:NDP-sugar pyrophosphorylase family protein
MLPIAILCGGLATRLHPVTTTIPKSLIPVRGEPFLAHQLRLLSRSGVSDVVLCVGYLGERIREFAGDGSAFDLRITYSWDGPALLGTAGAIRRALPLLGERFLVLYGDSYLPCDYRHVADLFSLSNCRGLMTVYRNEGQFDASNVELSNGRIVRYDKQQRTPQMNYIDYGLGAFQQTAFLAVDPHMPHDLATVYRSLLAAGELQACEIAERFYEIGSPSGIADFERYLTQTRDNNT